VPLQKDIITRTLATPLGERAYSVIEKLTDAGFDAWWVGGCVRDMFLGNVPNEIDVGTSALPPEVEKIFPKADSSAAALGTVRVRFPGMIIEVTTFREDDAASDGRRPESVSFGKREQDARRRDFTINAMYFQPISRELYDPYHGEDDLRERLIRFIEDPAIRIRHDALRIMRAVRFRARLQGQYHPETYHALRELARFIEPLSGNRKLEELEKMLADPHPDRALEDLWELGILPYISPELYACKGIPQPADYHHEGDVWEHMLRIARAFRAEDGADVRVAALFHDCGKAKTFSLKERIRFDEHASISGDLTDQALRQLQASNKRKEKIVWMIRHHMMMDSFSEMTDESKARWYYHPWFPELLQLFFLDIAGTDPADFHFYEAILQDYHSFLDTHPSPPKTLLSGEEIMEILHLKPGKEVGAILRELYGKQITKEVTSKREAIAFVKEREKESPSP
jgi:poly(A) polymerase